MNEPAEDPTIYEVIRQEHEEVADMLDALASEEDVEQREESLAELREALERHARAEEAVFYDVLMQHDEETRALARDAEKDHSEVRRLLAVLDATPPEEARWTATLAELTAAVQRHVETEENVIFAAVEAILDDDQARTLAETFEAMETRVQPEDEPGAGESAA